MPLALCLEHFLNQNTMPRTLSGDVELGASTILLINSPDLLGKEQKYRTRTLAASGSFEGCGQPVQLTPLPWSL